MDALFLSNMCRSYFYPLAQNISTVWPLLCPFTLSCQAFFLGPFLTGSHSHDISS